MIWRHWKTLICLAVVFAAGMLIGSALTVGAQQRVHAARMNPDTWAPRTLAWFHAELKTTSAQESALRPIVENSMNDMRALRDDAAQRWRTIVGKMLVDAAPQLDEGQRARLREVVKQAQTEKQRWPYGAPTEATSKIKASQ